MTTKEIARLANVSVGTVDRVLHDRGDVAEATKARVLKIIKDANYEPNIYARNLVLNKTYSIVALLPAFETGEYWHGPSKGVEKASIELRKFGVQVNLIYFDQHSAESFKKQVTKILKNKPDGVVVAPVLHAETHEFVKELVYQNIQVVSIDSRLEFENTLGFVGQDAFQSGILAARLMSSGKNTNGKYKIVSIKNSENHNNILLDRIRGFKEYFIKNQIDEVYFEEISIRLQNKGWNTILDNFLQIDDDMLGVFVPNSKVHFVAEFYQRQKQYDTPIVGYDLIDENTAYLENGIIDFLIDQKPERQGYQAVELFYKHFLLKQEIEKNNFMPLNIITKENMMYMDDGK